MFFFFLKMSTAYEMRISDWSSDVCSSDLLESMPGPKTQELSPPEARQLYLAMKDIADPPVGDLACIENLEMDGPAGPIALRLFDARETREPGPAVVFFHGGGFVFGDLDTHASLCAEMARMLDLPVVSVHYRLAPESRWPAAPADCEAAARWVAANSAAIGRPITGPVLAGDKIGRANR